MRLYLDSADQTQWQAWLPVGLFAGVTTNPTLLERARMICSIEQLQTLAHRSFDLGVKELHLQAWGGDIERLVRTGTALAAIDERVVVKLPITHNGTSAAAQLIARGIRVTLTGVYTRHQALVAAAVGANYAAPYLGRIDDLTNKGREELVAMQQALDGVGSTTRLLVASIRSIDDMAFLATQGLNAFTISADIATALFDVMATNESAATFEQAALGIRAEP